MDHPRTRDSREVEEGEGRGTLTSSISLLTLMSFCLQREAKEKKEAEEAAKKEVGYQFPSTTTSLLHISNVSFFLYRKKRRKLKR